MQPLAEIELTSSEAKTLLELKRRRAQIKKRRAFQEAGYFDSPSRFAQECIAWPAGRSLISYQADVMEQLNADHRLAVRGPRGLGKTAIAAMLVWWFALTRDAAGIPWKIATTAGSNRQLIEFLWPEIELWSHRIRWDVVGRGPVNRFELLTKKLKLKFGHAFGASTKDKSLIEGCHAAEVLAIFDESKAIQDDIFDAFEGAFSTGNAYALMLSTPGDPNGRFYDIHRRKAGLGHWNAVHVTLDQAMAAGQIPQSWVDICEAQWGRDSRLFRAHVLGEFSTISSDRQIPLLWVEQATERWHEWRAGVRDVLGMDPGSDLNFRMLREDQRRALAAAGLLGELTAVSSDVAGGGRDNALLAPRYGNVIPEIEIGSSDTMELTGRISSRLNENLAATAIVDIQTVGKGCGDRLRELGYNLIPFNGGKSTKFKNLSGDIESADTRTAAWLNMFDLLNPANGFDIILPDFELPEQKLSLSGDLTEPKFLFASSGKMKLESKNSGSDEDGGGLRKRLGRSTDAGDTAVMAFWPGEPEVDQGNWWVAGAGEIVSGPG